MPSRVNTARQRLGLGINGLGSLVKVKEERRAKPANHFPAEHVGFVPIAKRWNFGVLAMESRCRVGGGHPIQLHIVVEWVSVEGQRKSARGAGYCLGLDDVGNNLAHT